MDKRCEELSSYMEMSREAVLGLRRRHIVFANAAARALFPNGCNDDIMQLMPPLPENEGEPFAFSLRLGGRNLDVSGVCQGGLTILTLVDPPMPYGAIPAPALTELRRTAYNIQLPAEQLLAQEPSDENTMMLRHGSYALRRVLQNLGDANDLATRRMTLHRESLDLAQVFSMLLDSSRCFLRDGVRLETELKGSFPVLGDKRRLCQMLLNLLSNALLHTPAGGVVRVGLSKQGSMVVLSVSDTGSGIPSDELCRLFDPNSWELRHAGSARLGLYIVRGIAQLHGGTLLVQSREGEGSRVWVALPMSNSLPLWDSDNKAVGPSLILTELATVLDHKAYSNRYMD